MKIYRCTLCRDAYADADGSCILVIDDLSCSDQWEKPVLCPYARDGSADWREVAE